MSRLDYRIKVKLVKGIKLGKEEVKIIQFADDTTIFLDGTEGSLQKTLNIIETFGTYSGLKISLKDKSELIWLGRKNTQKKVYVKTLLSLGERQILRNTHKKL